MRKKTLLLATDARIDWKRFEQLIHDQFRVNAVAFDKIGHRRTLNNLWANGLCRLIKAHPNAKKLICDTLLQSMIHKARAIRQYVTDECSAGIYRRLFPIVQGFEIKGFFGVCGRPFSTNHLMYADYIHRVTGITNSAIEELIDSVAPISPRHIKEMTSFIIEEGFRACLIEGIDQKSGCVLVTPEEEISQKRHQ